MSRTPLAIQLITRAGIDPALTEAANVDGESIVNAGDVFVYVDNGDTVSMDVTFLIPGNIDAEFIADGGRKEAIPAGEDRFFGPFTPKDYNQAGGLLFVDFSAVVSLSVGAFRLPR